MIDACVGGLQATQHGISVGTHAIMSMGLFGTDGAEKASPVTSVIIGASRVRRHWRGNEVVAFQAPRWPFSD